MTRKETVKLFTVFTSAYPRFDTFKNPGALKPVIELWTEMLADVPYPVVEAAAKKLILESPYPPTISDVRKQVADITADPKSKIDGATAWGEVSRAVREYGWYDPDGALQSMSPRSRKVVRSIGWKEICMCDKPGVVRGQFLKMYDSYVKRERKDALLPERLKGDIRQIGNRQKQLKEG